MDIPSEVMERYRDINVDHDWWDCTYDYWKSRLERLGVDVEEINFSGFWCQGDGASFTGRIGSGNLKRFMRIHGMRERYRAIYTVLDHLSGWVGIYRNSHQYAHPYTVTTDAYLEDPTWIDYDTEDLREVLVQELYNEARLHWADFDEEVENILRGYMDTIYRDLEKEYDHLTSEKAVTEAIIANDLYDPNQLNEE